MYRGCTEVYMAGNWSEIQELKRKGNFLAKTKKKRQFLCCMCYFIIIYTTSQNGTFGIHLIHWKVYRKLYETFAQLPLVSQLGDLTYTCMVVGYQQLSIQRCTKKRKFQKTLIGALLSPLTQPHSYYSGICII